MYNVRNCTHFHAHLCTMYTLHPMYSLHTAQVSGAEHHMIVMKNVFAANLRLHKKYDLKGSTVDREATDKDHARKDGDFLKEEVTPTRMPDSTLQFRITVSHYSFHITVSHYSFHITVFTLQFHIYVFTFMFSHSDPTAMCKITSSWKEENQNSLQFFSLIFSPNVSQVLGLPEPIISYFWAFLIKRAIQCL